MGRSGESNRPAAIDPFRPAVSTTGSDRDSRRFAGRLGRLIPEMEVELKLALDEFGRAANLAKAHAIPSRELERSKGKVLIAASRVEGLDEEFADEIARLKLEMKRKLAEADRDNAMGEVATTVVARNARLNERKPGMVSSEDVTKSEAELKVAHAAIAIKQVEIEEVSLQIRQLERVSERTSKLIGLAKDAKAQVRVP